MNILRVKRNSTQLNATQLNATQRKLLLCLSLSNLYIKIFEKSKPAYGIFS